MVGLAAAGVLGIQTETVWVAESALSFYWPTGWKLPCPGDKELSVEVSPAAGAGVPALLTLSISIFFACSATLVFLLQSFAPWQKTPCVISPVFVSQANKALLLLLFALSLLLINNLNMQAVLQPPIFLGILYT